jgi:hypothetical protein
VAVSAADAPGVCQACGSATGRWGALRVGDQPVRLNNAVMVGRMCSDCGAVELRGRDASPGPVAAAPRPLGRQVLDGFLRNVWDAIRAVSLALRERVRRPKE